MKRERLGFRGKLEAKAAADVLPGTFSGYGAIFNESHPTSSWQLPPDWTDTIKPGAFQAALEEDKANGVMPAMCLQHDVYDLPIGKWLSMTEDARGLLSEGIVATDTTMGGDVYKLMKMGALDGLSIGFIVNRFELDQKAKQRAILEVDLLETSIVTIPAIDTARVTDVKAARVVTEALSSPRSFEKLLQRELGLSRSMAQRLMADGYKAMLVQRDADEDPEPALRDAGGDGGKNDEEKELAKAMEALAAQLRSLAA